MEDKALNNLPPFYVGQKVVYITGISMPKDSIHTVTFVCKAPCGCFEIEVDNTKNFWKGDRTINYWRCLTCAKTYLKSLHGSGWSCESFRPLQESVFPSLTLSRVIEKERELVSMN